MEAASVNAGTDEKHEFNKWWSYVKVIKCTFIEGFQ